MELLITRNVFMSVAFQTTNVSLFGLEYKFPTVVSLSFKLSSLKFLTKIFLQPGISIATFVTYF